MNWIQPIISSRKNSTVIETAALHEKKYRETRGLFLIEGEKLVAEAMEHALPITALFFAQSRVDALRMKWQAYFAAQQYDAVDVFTLTDDCFLKISSEKAPQGVIAVLKHLDFFERMTIIYTEDILSRKCDRTVFLYGIQDPGNLGAVIRSAVAFGATCIVLSRECADLYNSKTVRAAMGSLFRVRILVVEDFASAITAFQANGRRVLAAELRDGAMPIGEIGLIASDCLIIGNEGHGIPRDISDRCDGSVYLPISKNAESLNASVAASIFLWEQSKT